MRFVYPMSTPTPPASQRAQSQSSPPTAPKLTGTTPGLLDPTQPQRLLRNPGSKLSFAYHDPLTACTTSSLDHEERDQNGKSSFRPNRIVIETSSSGESTWRFVPKARLGDGASDEGMWPRVVDVCGIKFELSQEQWEIYKLDPTYDCVIRDASHIPAIIQRPAGRTDSASHTNHIPRPSSPIRGVGQKRRAPSPTVEPDESETAPSSPVPHKKRAPNPTSASVRVETETETEDENASESESEESEVEGMIVDDDEQSQSQSQSQNQTYPNPHHEKQSRHRSQSRGRARSVKLKDKIHKDRKQRQQKTARRTEWLSNQDTAKPGPVPPSASSFVPAWGPQFDGYSMLNGAYDSAPGSASGYTSSTTSPSLGKRKKHSSTSDTTPRGKNEAQNAASSHTRSSRPRPYPNRTHNDNTESSRNDSSSTNTHTNTRTNYYTTNNTAKRARTASPPSTKRSLWAYKQAREKQKAEWRRMMQDERVRMREEEILEGLFSEGAGPHGENGFGSQQVPVNRSETVEMFSVHSDADPTEEDGEMKEPSSSGTHHYGTSTNAHTSTTATPKNAASPSASRSVPEPDLENDDENGDIEENEEEDAERRARIEESRRKLAKLEADRPLWERLAAERKERERKEREELKRKLAEELEREQRRIDEEVRRQQERLREEAARRKAEQESRARQQHQQQHQQQRQRTRRQRDSIRHGHWTIERAKERYNDLSEKFDGTKFGLDARKGEVPLTAYDVPWPILQREYDLEDVTWQSVADFFDAVRPSMRPMEFKKMIIKSHVRFHTDRWASRRLLESVVDDAERECIEIANKMVIQQLTPIWEEVCGKKLQE